MTADLSGTQATNRSEALPLSHACSSPIRGHIAWFSGFPIIWSIYTTFAILRLPPQPLICTSCRWCQGSVVNAALAPRLLNVTLQSPGWYRAVQKRQRSHSHHSHSLPNGFKKQLIHTHQIVKRQTYIHVTGWLLLLHFWTICLPFISFYNIYIKSYQTTN